MKTSHSVVMAAVRSKHKPGGRQACGRTATGLSITGSRGHTAGRSGPHKLTCTRPISAAAANPHDVSPQIAVSATAEPAAPATVDLDTPLPSHPELVRGRLENGFEYVIIPNRSPPNRFEAHLQMHVGSIHENDDEQGVAHFVEHVTFLGSTKRESLLSLGVRSNAYTDFHHTVFHMSSELKNDLYNMEMLPHVIDALAEIAFRAEFLRTRIEKERKAVLAEAQMMNTIEYRMDCQLLGYLHEENELGNRFPIGLVDQVKSWDRKKLHEFWRKWYFPANATLYIVGDVSTPGALSNTVKLIQKHFGDVEAGKNPDGTPKARNLGLPPVQHAFGVGRAPPEGKPCKVSMFRHSLVSNYILSVFAKLPVHPMMTLRHAREQVIYRILVSTYQRRINARYIDGEEQFHAIEYEIADSSRESSCVVALTITAEPKNWEQATRVAVQEAQRMQHHGVTQSELDQYMAALMSSSAQQAAATDTTPHIEMLELAMECLTNGQVFNSNIQAHEAMMAIADQVTLEDVHAIARSFFSFIGDYGREAQAAADAEANPGKYYTPGPIRTTSIIACVPTFVMESGDAIEGGISARAGSSMSTGGHLDGSDIDVDAIVQPGMDLEFESEEPPVPGSVKFDISEATIQAVMSEVHDLPPVEDVKAPETLISAEDLQRMLEEHKPQFVPVRGREAEGATPPPDVAAGVVQRRLSNGCTLNYKVSDNDPSSAGMRLCMSGGRAAEVTEGAGPAGVGAMQIGLRTISEGGTMGQFCREEIEMFCLARLINCYIDTDPENNFIDWYSSSDTRGLRGMFELCHLMIMQPCWTESGFRRAKTTILSNSRAVNKSMERANHDKILHMVFGEDRRFREPNAEEIEALTLEGCRAVLEKFMRPDNIEVSLVGDFDPEVAEQAFLEFMGTIPAREEPLPLPHVPISFNSSLPVSERHTAWHLNDSDERGVGNVAGLGFRRWGDINGSGPVEALTSRVQPPPDPSTIRTQTDMVLAQTLRRAHPLFAPTVLLFLQEIINSRLFVTVRDQLNLTYDVSFEVVQHDRLNSSWWCATVTASPPKIADATQASLQVLRDCKTANPVSFSEVQRTQTTLLTRHESDLKDNQYVLNLLTHLQAVDVPLKTIDTLRDLPAMMLSITSTDINDALSLFGLNDDEVYTSIATSGPRQLEPAPALKLQASGESEKFKSMEASGGAVSDLLMKAMADAMMAQMRGKAWGEGGLGAAPKAGGKKLVDE